MTATSPVPGHDSRDPLHIGWPASIHNGCHLLEVIRADERGSNNGQRLRIGLPQVVKTMNCATRNKTTFPRAHIHRLSFQGARHHALNPVDGLVEFPVIMWQRYLCTRLDREFKHRNGTVRVGSLEEKSNLNLPHADGFLFHSDVVSNSDLTSAQSPARSTLNIDAAPRLTASGQY